MQSTLLFPVHFKIIAKNCSPDLHFFFRGIQREFYKDVFVGTGYLALYPYLILFGRAAQLATRQPALLRYERLLPARAMHELEAL